MKIINWFKQNYWLTLIILVSALLRLYHIDYQSFWLDEIHTLNEAHPQNSFREVYEALLISEPHPPLYFFLVHVLFKIFGYTTFVARVFSAVIGIAGVISIYLLGKEIFNKKIGLYAAILITFNYFQLYYSQEARMYSLLFLTTTLSFLYLIKFIKKPSYKSSILYGLFSTLMIYTHFFGAFVLISQYLILLYFIIKPFNTNSKQFLIFTVISGLISVVLYIPTYPLILKTTEMTSIWIAMPSLDVYTQFFKDFFGQSELVVFFILLLIAMFFIQLFKEKNSKNLSINPIEDKLVFSFFILFVWILTVLILPLIRTYTSLPMLINRYFVAILPAVILVVAIGLYYVKNNVVRYSILLIIVVFSITDIVVVKKYYYAVNRTQFREATEYIIEKNNKNHKVVSSLSWYLSFYLQNPDENYEIVGANLDDFVENQMLNNQPLTSFWYFDAHGRDYSPKPETSLFLNENYVVQDNYAGLQAWTRHYVVKNEINTKVEYTQEEFTNITSNKEYISNIEVFNLKDKQLSVAGWVFLENVNSKNTKIQLVLLNHLTGEFIQTLEVSRPDVTSYFKLDYNADYSGFESNVNLNSIPEGNYTLGIWLKNETENIEALILTEREIKI